jgi:hypothetical protein
MRPSSDKKGTPLLRKRNAPLGEKERSFLEKGKYLFGKR